MTTCHQRQARVAYSTSPQAVRRGRMPATNSPDRKVESLAPVWATIPETDVASDVDSTWLPSRLCQSHGTSG